MVMKFRDNSTKRPANVNVSRGSGSAIVKYLTDLGEGTSATMCSSVRECII